MVDFWNESLSEQESRHAAIWAAARESRRKQADIEATKRMIQQDLEIASYNPALWQEAKDHKYTHADYTCFLVVRIEGIIGEYSHDSLYSVSISTLEALLLHLRKGNK